MSRYGDGEFLWMLGWELNSYQKNSEKLQQALIESVNYSGEDVITGVPKSLFDSSGCTLKHSMTWTVQRARILPGLMDVVDFRRKFVDTNFTRPWSDRLDEGYAERTFSQLKRIWEGRDVCMIEGGKTKLGMGNDLFSGARSIRRIIGPAENAFDRIDDIMETVKGFVSKDMLLLLALGPAASVLSVRLTSLGYQAVDLGHIDVDYMWFNLRSSERVNIPGKYVNEAGRIKMVQDSLYDSDTEYLNSIVCRIE